MERFLQKQSFTELIYKGVVFSVEAWRPSLQKSLVVEWLEKQSQKDQAKFSALFVRMGNQGKIYNEQKFKHLTDTQLYEFKVDDKRILSFFVWDRRIILTHGFAKKSKKTPRNEILRAEIIRNSFFTKVLNDKYKKLD